MTTTLEQLAQLIRKQRRQRHLTQSELAKRTGIGKKTLTNMETVPDKHDIGIQKYLRILHELDIVIELNATERSAQVNGEAPGTAVQELPLTDYPQLRLLMWNRTDENTISEADAFALYEREWRHIDETTLTEKEQKLIERLSHQYGHGVMHV